MFTDGSGLDEGAENTLWYSKMGNLWGGGIETHMGHNQEAYGVECVALARALETTSRR